MSKLFEKPEIRRMKLVDIKPNPENPREITDKAMSGLRSSLAEFGYVDLIVVNKRDKAIVSGHQRYRALTESGADEADVILVDLDREGFEELSLTMNNPEVAGDWTGEVRELLDEIRAAGVELYENLNLQALREDIRLVDVKHEEGKQGRGVSDDVKCPRCGRIFPNEAKSND